MEDGDAKKKNKQPKNAGLENKLGELYTPEEVAEYLKVAPSTVYNWFKTGKLIGHIISRGKRKSTVRFDEEQIKRFANSMNRR